MSLRTPYRNRLPMAYLPAERALLDNPAGGDDAYMDAVRRGDMVTAQRLVDAAARAAGVINNGKPLYHGGNKTKTSFEAGAQRTGIGRVYLTDDKRVAWKYALGGGIDKSMSLPEYRRQQLSKLPSREPTVQKLFVVGDVADFSSYTDRPTVSKLMEMFGEERMSKALEQFSYTYDEMLQRGDTVEEVLDQALQEGGFVREDTDATANVPELQFLKGTELLEPYMKKIGKNVIAYDDAEAGGKTYVVFDAKQIKSADPVTYDDAGQVIPLSQRFQMDSPDIRNPRTRSLQQFPYEYAAYLKKNFPEIWRAGGNIRGNDTFRWWTAYRKGDRSPTVMRWWNVTRPAWIARHYKDYRLPGVIAQIKWGTVGKLGVAGMKRVVEDAIKKRYAD